MKYSALQSETVFSRDLKGGIGASSEWSHAIPAQRGSGYQQELLMLVPSIQVARGNWARDDRSPSGHPGSPGIAPVPGQNSIFVAMRGLP